MCLWLHTMNDGSFLESFPLFSKTANMKPNFQAVFTKPLTLLGKRCKNSLICPENQTMFWDRHTSPWTLKHYQAFMKDDIRKWKPQCPGHVSLQKKCLVFVRVFFVFSKWKYLKPNSTVQIAVPTVCTKGQMTQTEGGKKRKLRNILSTTLTFLCRVKQMTSSTSQAVLCLPREQGINPLLCLIQPWQDSTSTYVTTGQFHGLEESFPPTGLSVGLRKGEDSGRQIFMNCWLVMTPISGHCSENRHCSKVQLARHREERSEMWGDVGYYLARREQIGRRAPTIIYGCKSFTWTPCCRVVDNSPLVYYGLASPSLLLQIKPCFILKYVFMGFFHGTQFNKVRQTCGEECMYCILL